MWNRAGPYGVFPSRPFPYMLCFSFSLKNLDNSIWCTFPELFCCCLVTQSCPTLWDPMDCSTPGFSVLHYLPEFAQIQVHWVGDAHLILCCPLLFLPSIFPSIRIFSNESAFPIRWPKYWSFIFSISPSNEYPGLISFRIDWFDVLAVQGTLKSLPQHHNLKASMILWCLTFFVIQFSLINFNLFMFRLHALYSNLTPLLSSLEQFHQGYLKCCLWGLKS